VISHLRSKCKHGIGSEQKPRTDGGVSAHRRANGHNPTRLYCGDLRLENAQKLVEGIGGVEASLRRASVIRVSLSRSAAAPQVPLLQRVSYEECMGAQPLARADKLVQGHRTHALIEPTKRNQERVT
jgi:hypothetical protein